MASFALHGIGVSAGIAIGRAQLVSHATLEVAHYAIPLARIEAEIARFANAVAEVRQELEGLHATMTGGDAPADGAEADEADDAEGQPVELDQRSLAKGEVRATRPRPATTS